MKLSVFVFLPIDKRFTAIMRLTDDFTDKTGTAQRPSRVLRQGVPKYQKIKINEIFTFKFLA